MADDPKFIRWQRKERFRKQQEKRRQEEENERQERLERLTSVREDGECNSSLASENEICFKSLNGATPKLSYSKENPRWSTRSLPIEKKMQREWNSRSTSVKYSSQAREISRAKASRIVRFDTTRPSSLLEENDSQFQEHSSYDSESKQSRNIGTSKPLKGSIKYPSPSPGTMDISCKRKLHFEKLSDDDDDEDMYEIAKSLERKAAKTESTKCSTLHDTPSNHKSSNQAIGVTAAPGSGSSCDSEDDFEKFFNQDAHSGSKWVKKREQHHRQERKMQSDLDDQDDSNHSEAEKEDLSECNKPRKHKKRNVHSAWERKQKQNEKLQSMAALLDEDTDEDESKPTRKTVNPTGRRRTAANDAIRGKKPKLAMPSIADDTDDEMGDETKLQEALHPNFEKPRFGPFPMEPLILKQTKGSTKHDRVPSSINRYLLPYQREGIQFLHNALSRGSGAILGDEMGLGKTIQVISLLAALLCKTGTGMDFSLLRRRRHQIDERMNLFSKAREDALLSGKLFDAEKQQIAKTAGNEWMPILLVVPITTFDNWLNEFKTWGHFAVVEYRGSHRESAIELMRKGCSEVLICGNSLFTQAAHFSVLNEIKWSLVVIDEFHLFKNEKGLLSQNLRTLTAAHRSLVIGMTGTPLQNRHKELWNLVDLVEPGYLGSSTDFNTEIAIPIKLARSKATSEEVIKCSEKKRQELAKLLKPLFLERKKKDVLEGQMPDKHEMVIFCELSELQKRLYEHILSLPDFRMLRTANGPCDCGVNQNFFLKYKNLRTKQEKLEYQRKNRYIQRKDCCHKAPWKEPGVIDPDAVLWRSSEKHLGDQECDKCPFCILFPAIQKLYKLCSHVALIQVKQQASQNPVSPQKHNSYEKERAFARVAFPPDVVSQLPGQSLERNDGIMDDHFSLSGKLKVLDRMLKRLNSSEDRVLLFSFSTETIDLIQNYLRSEGFSFLRMDGSTHTAKRQELADRFNNDPDIFIFLLSTKATGLGLNLARANHVIMFDVEWNPSWDQQAQDRAYRIGQDRNVQVTRLVARGTIEELKYLRQIYKVQLSQDTLGAVKDSAPQAARIFRGVAEDKDRKGELFGTENLLKYKDGSFMEDLWKQMNSTQFSSVGDGVKIHNSAQLEKTLEMSNMETVEGILRKDEPSLDEFCDDGVASNLKANRSAYGDETKAMNHSDFFRNDRGRALVELGDDGFEGEMGGVSQVIHEICEKVDVPVLDGVASDIQREDSSNNSSHQSPKPINRATVSRSIGKAMTKKSDLKAFEMVKAPKDVVKSKSRLKSIAESSEASNVSLTHHDTEDKQLVETSMDLSKRSSAKQVYAQEPALSMDMEQKEDNRVKNTNKMSPESRKIDHPVASREKKRKSHRNTLLLGEASNRMGRRKKGTTFSALDIHVPSSSRKKNR